MDIEYSFPYVEWIYHHHDEDEVDLEEVKLMKRLLRHLTILHHHLNFKDNQVSPMPQSRFFPPMTSEVYQAYMNFWYNQTQAQTQTGKMPYLAPLPMTFAQSSTQQGVKLSELVKEVRLLGCEIFFRLVDAIVA